MKIVTASKSFPKDSKSVFEVDKDRWEVGF